MSSPMCLKCLRPGRLSNSDWCRHCWDEWWQGVAARSAIQVMAAKRRRGEP